MDVRDGAGLHFDDFEKADPHVIRIGPGGFQMPAECSPQGDGESSPQLRQMPGEQHMPEIVVAFPAERLANLWIGVVVDSAAPQWISM
ncbi:Uncharacterised protein [Mycobacteroides abscessus]|nr:Uncharacterised protein [Mycobacteroides abscessus]